ncbi:hypothetical protein GOC38_14790 [Sinorhizobium meliloti]|nr:hypothetical protein [Sinorhizobium meliloti]MDX0325498.1 hypothetical protein [Sinorhizobium meliloti]MDX1045475.1 hypothetical protein [Sinorhizobium medicae]
MKTTSSIIEEAEALLETAQFGLDDLKHSAQRKMAGLRNAIVFARSVTLALQNLSSREPGFDEWYEPIRQSLKADRSFKILLDARNSILKAATTPVFRSTYFNSRTTLGDLGPRPKNATGFFLADTNGGSGWFIKLPDGSEEKMYVVLPAGSMAASIHLFDKPDGLATELIEHCLARLREIVREARRTFLSERPADGSAAQ